MKKNVIFSLFLFVLIVSGCSLYTVSSEETTPDYYASKSSPNEVLYVENVTQPHHDIGYVIVNTERRNNLDQVLDKLKREAAILGADAITNIQTDATGFWKKLPGQRLLRNAYIRHNFRATMVIFAQPENRPIKSDVWPTPEPEQQETQPEENLK